MDFAFNSDGCSNPIRYLCKVLADLDFAKGCYLHDWAYWKGGTSEERQAADRALYEFIRANSKHKWAAPLYWSAVRVFGWLPFSDQWSWGYGWMEDRRGPETKIPKPDETSYTEENQRWKLEKLLNAS